ncbi:hypothetical protein GCM10017044_04070 [Kordiimonas sediminis]|uniref:TIGR02300 family protein n=1 Tax=Kordiimonas sediminis TaxID=1735581 RepID=A0A919ALC3_9PROT|nr:FYDLN acid domain-containing protein [Kordiimonas sediminis]GHF13276.1 hypothetical protein GCM10017044_04070 [Kordiimonas sediminis]
MAKEEWGTKRTCPSCGTRFYDLKKNDPVTCIDCGNEWVPEPVLKTKQPIIVEDKEEDSTEGADALDSDDDDIDVDDIDDISLDDDDDTEVKGMVDTSLSDDDE